MIVTIRERDTGQAYRGYVTFLVVPPAGEPGPPVIPLELGPGQFESAHVFRGPGVHALSIVFDAEGAERHVGPIPVSVRAVGRTAASIALARVRCVLSTVCRARCKSEASARCRLPRHARARATRARTTPPDRS